MKYNDELTNAMKMLNYSGGNIEQKPSPSKSCISDKKKKISRVNFLDDNDGELINNENFKDLPNFK